MGGCIIFISYNKNMVNLKDVAFNHFAGIKGVNTLALYFIEQSSKK